MTVQQLIDQLTDCDPTAVITIDTPAGPQDPVRVESLNSWYVLIHTSPEKL